ncbi:MAG: GntR family transcriptional regulator, partial [Microbacterium sp.]
MSTSMTPEVIADRISLAIREKVLVPGAPLVQEDLARRFNVSRSPVREALRILATAGVVTMSPGGSASVRSLARAEIEELYDLRLMIEPTIAEPIILNATAADADELESLARAMAETKETDEWMRLNFRFLERLYG